MSYSRTDDVYVRRLVRHLRDHGVDVWLDGDGIDYGDRWATVIAEKVDSCAVFIPVMTPESERSEWVEREVARAQESHRPIMPLLLAGRPFFRLGATQFESVVGRRMPAERYVAALRSLAPGPLPDPAPDPSTFDVALAASISSDSAHGSTPADPGRAYSGQTHPEPAHGGPDSGPDSGPRDADRGDPTTGDPQSGPAADPMAAGSMRLSSTDGGGNNPSRRAGTSVPGQRGRNAATKTSSTVDDPAADRWNSLGWGALTVIGMALAIASFFTDPMYRIYGHGPRFLLYAPGAACVAIGVTVLLRRRHLTAAAVVTGTAGVVTLFAHRSFGEARDLGSSSPTIGILATVLAAAVLVPVVKAATGRQRIAAVCLAVAVLTSYQPLYGGIWQPDIGLYALFGALLVSTIQDSSLGVRLAYLVPVVAYAVISAIRLARYAPEGQQWIGFVPPVLLTVIAALAVPRPTNGEDPRGSRIGSG